MTDDDRRDPDDEQAVLDENVYVPTGRLFRLLKIAICNCCSDADRDACVEAANFIDDVTGGPEVTSNGVRYDCVATYTQVALQHLATAGIGQTTYQRAQALIAAEAAHKALRSDEGRTRIADSLAGGSEAEEE